MFDAASLRAVNCNHIIKMKLVTSLSSRLGGLATKIFDKEKIDTNNKKLI